MKTLLAQLFVFFSITALSAYYIPEHILGFFLGIGVQYALYYMWKSVLETYAITKAKEVDLLLAKEYSAQGLEVECPCSKKAKAFVPIRLDEENIYKCPGCDKEVKVIITADTALVTVPLVNTDTQNPANYKI